MLIAVTALFWVAALTRTWRWCRSPRSPAVRAIAIALLSIATALTLDVPQVSLMLGERPNDANAGDVAQKVAIVAGAWACQSLLLHLTRGPEASAGSERRRAATAISVATVSAALHATSVTLYGPSPDPTGGRAAPLITESGLLVQVYAAIVLFQVMLLCWRHAAKRTSYLGRGVQLIGLGCMTMVIYSTTRIGYFSAAQYAGVLLPALHRSGDILQSFGLGAIAVGTLIPRVGRLLDKRRRRDAHEVLEPLWQLVTDRVPAVIFAAAPTTDLAAWHLARRVIEIQDSLVLLAPHLVAVTDTTTDPAEQLAEALLGLDEPVEVTVGPGRAPVGHIPIAAPESMEDVDWLMSVSRALQRVRQASAPAR